MNLLCVGVDHHANSVEARERLSLSGEGLEQTLRFFAAHRSFQEMVIVSTCNRVEFYMATGMTQRQAVAELKESLKEFLEIQDTGLDQGYVHRNEAAVRHLFEVCSGLQSMVVGETEIFGQVKEAYQTAKRVGSCGPVLNRLFQTAFNAAKEVRTRSAVGRGNVSVASVAVQAAGRIVGNLKNKRVLVLGAGDTGQKVTQGLVEAGVAHLFCANRRNERVLTLASQYAVEPVAWTEWKGRLGEMDIVLCSTSAPGSILRRKDLEPHAARFETRPILLIDLAVPRDVEPTAGLIPGVCLLNVDDLRQVASENLAVRLKERGKALALLEPLAEKLISYFYKQGILLQSERARAARP
jgi:glutamyl-tRNA reductase